MQRTVQQRRRVAIRQDEAVTVDPLRIRRIVLHQLVVEQVGDRRAAKRGAGMAGLRLFNGVNGEKPEGVDGKLIEFVLLRILLFAHCYSFVGDS
jgi:hypothetical protein